jgi:hypothetical protein
MLLIVLIRSKRTACHLVRLTSDRWGLQLEQRGIKKAKDRSGGGGLSILKRWLGCHASKIVCLLSTPPDTPISKRASPTLPLYAKGGMSRCRLTPSFAPTMGVSTTFSECRMSQSVKAKTDCRPVSIFAAIVPKTTAATSSRAVRGCRTVVAGGG